MEVLSHRERLRLRVMVVAFAPPSALQAYEGRFGLVDVPLLSDPDRSAYTAFGFGRGSFARVWLHPAVWWRYARLVAARRRPEPAHEDTLQLGGDVLAGADGRVRWVHRSAGPEDRPTIPQIERALSRDR